MNQVEELEQAIIDRALALAEEAKARAVTGRSNILREAAERLAIREEKETQLAKSRAERAYRQRVQAEQLKINGKMDRLRWNLVESVLKKLRERLQQLTRDEARYHRLLAALLARGVELLAEDELIVQLNATDLSQLQADWPTFAAEAVPGKRIRLSDTPIDTLGGLRLHTPDNRIEVDQTFEGRMARLERKLHQRIVERLLPPAGGVSMP